MFFIDESGSMPKVQNNQRAHRYFVITFIHTDDPQRTKSVYKNAIRTLRAKYPTFFAGLANPNELKGSEALPHMKYYLISKLKRLTDIRIGHMVVDNWNIDQRFRDIPGRSFNYLIKIFLQNFQLSQSDKQRLMLCIDNRNVALEGLRELEGFLYNELVLHDQIVNGVSVNYLESCDSYNIQIADMISHVIYQRFRYKTISFPNYSRLTKGMDIIHPYSYEFLYNELKPNLVVPFVFPPRSELIRDAAATFSL